MPLPSLRRAARRFLSGRRLLAVGRAVRAEALTYFERIVPHLIPGDVLVIDDYEHWSGCRKAVDAFFADKQEGFEFVKRSRLHIVRRDAA
ncbi:MAG: hypothetical protein HKN04_01460 [Rhodothermaceae bacterium]|nr:hypothetical protein [Rhodothermaceae bacterium]